MNELYRQMWNLFLAFVTIFGSMGALWLALEIGIGWLLDRAGEARERRRRSFRRVAARHGRTVKER
ncbi:MAG: hypothetical protein ACOX83_12230 [Candidatus Spyradocola sp.]|jgi:hypothetical protein